MQKQMKTRNVPLRDTPTDAVDSPPSWIRSAVRTCKKILQICDIYLDAMKVEIKAIDCHSDAG